MRVFTRPELSILIHLLLLLKYNTVNKIIKYTGGILSRGILSWGDFVLGGILSRGILSGGFCPGGFCPGGFCPDTLMAYPDFPTRKKHLFSKAVFKPKKTKDPYGEV